MVCGCGQEFEGTDTDFCPDCNLRMSQEDLEENPSQVKAIMEINRRGIPEPLIAQAVGIALIVLMRLKQKYFKKK